MLEGLIVNDLFNKEEKLRAACLVLVVKNFEDIGLPEVIDTADGLVEYIQSGKKPEPE